jgi:hypothetical protein
LVTILVIRGCSIDCALALPKHGAVNSTAPAAGIEQYTGRLLYKRTIPVRSKPRTENVDRLDCIKCQEIAASKGNKRWYKVATQKKQQALSD